MKTKTEARKEILDIRNNLDIQDAISKSEIIIQKLVSMEEYKLSSSVMVYMDFKNEVNTKKFIENALSEGKKVIIPYTDIKNVEIIPVEIKSFDDLVMCKFGYLEPQKEKTENPYDVKEIDLIVVPGVAFDKAKNRVGFGKGYYDRLLSNRNPSAKAIAIAYEFQVFEQVQAEEFDIKMDIIITEKNIYK